MSRGLQDRSSDMLDVNALCGEARATARWWGDRLREIRAQAELVISQPEAAYAVGSNIEARQREYNCALTLHQSLCDENLLTFERLLALHIHETIVNDGYRVISPRGRFELIDPAFAAFLYQAGIATETGHGKILHHTMFTAARRGFVFARGVDESQTGCMFFVETT